MSTIVQIKTERLDDEVQHNNFSSGPVSITSTFDKMAVKLLISFVAEIYDQLTNPDNRHKKQFWEHILVNINEKGYAFSWQQLQKKWNNLVETYRNNLRKKLKSGRGSLKWEFFDSMEQIVGSEQISTQDLEEPSQMFSCSMPTTNSCSPPHPSTPPPPPPPPPQHPPHSFVSSNPPPSFVPSNPPLPSFPLLPVIIPFSGEQVQVIQNIENCSSSVNYEEQIPSNCVYTVLNEDVKASSSSTDDNEEVVLRGHKRKLREGGGGVAKKRNDGINAEILKELRTLNSLKKQALEQRIKMFNVYKEINEERNRCLAELSASVAQIAQRQFQ